jgi:hypothetical protein
METTDGRYEPRHGYEWIEPAGPEAYNIVSQAAGDVLAADWT